MNYLKREEQKTDGLVFYTLNKANVALYRTCLINPCICALFYAFATKVLSIKHSFGFIGEQLRFSILPDLACRVEQPVIEPPMISRRPALQSPHL